MDGGGCHMCRQLAERLAAASAVLGRLAEKDGLAREVVAMRAALADIADGNGDARQVALDALGWRK